MRIAKRCLLLGLMAGTLVACGDDGGEEECTAANAEVLEGTINANAVTLTQCTRVVERVEIENGSRLTIEPGSTLFFEEGAGLWLKDTSVLDAAGTVDEPLLFTGTSRQAGAWRNIYLGGASSTENLIEHATIEYAGQGDEPAVHVEDSGALTVRDTTIRQSAAAGFHLQEGVDVVPAVTFEDNTVTENVLAGMAGPMAAAQIDPSNDLTGNGADRIEIDGPGNVSDITTETTYRNIGIPYVFLENVGIKNGALWTLEAGVEILAPANGRIVVNEDGALSATGTADEPVVFRGAEDQAGYWQHLYFDKTPSTNNLLQNTVIDDAGGGGDEDSAALHLQSGRDAAVNVAFDGLTIRDSAHLGIVAKEGNNGVINVSGCDTLSFENVAQANIEGPICQ